MSKFIILLFVATFAAFITAEFEHDNDDLSEEDGGFFSFDSFLGTVGKAMQGDDTDGMENIMNMKPDGPGDNVKGSYHRESHHKTIINGEEVENADTSEDVKNDNGDVTVNDSESRQ